MLDFEVDVQEVLNLTVKPMMLLESEMADYLVLKGRPVHELTVYDERSGRNRLHSEKIEELAKELGYGTYVLRSDSADLDATDDKAFGRMFILEQQLSEHLQKLADRQLGSLHRYQACDCDMGCETTCQKKSVCHCGKVLSEEDGCGKPGCILYDLS